MCGSLDDEYSHSTPKSLQLLTRTEFREGVFARDNNLCVNCGLDAQDAHHIIERKLWTHGGYYLDNGASLCGDCHYEAEKTLLTCDTIRAKAGIRNLILPEHLSPNESYDKWGNILLPNGMRVRGELFYDEQVQKILAAGGVLTLFQPWVKYPRTFHLPNSPGLTDDDKALKNYDDFLGERVIITEKRDGENTSIYTNYVHARSLTQDSHWSKNWIKAFQTQIGYLIPDGWRICGENLFAKHSIGYDNLETFFEAFSIWDDRNYCLPWDESLEWFELIGVKPVPVLYDGTFSIDILKNIQPQDLERCEGYVVRKAKGFHYSQFKQSVAKWARANHVRTANNWKTKAIELNSLGGV